MVPDKKQIYSFLSPIHPVQFSTTRVPEKQF